MLNFHTKKKNSKIMSNITLICLIQGEENLNNVFEVKIERLGTLRNPVVASN